MKHLSFILVLLMVSVATTACINNFAVQELNNNAKVYMDKGDVDAAICRLKSSLELDSAVWETHYNLATAYFNGEKYKEAQVEYKEAIKLNPELPDAYFSLAVAFETEANSLEKLYREENKKLDKEFLDKVVTILNDAIKYYDLYSTKITSESEKTETQERIATLKALVASYLATNEG